MTYSNAVIGNGMAGLTAAYRARRAGHQATVLEALDSHGMDAHALSMDCVVVGIVNETVPDAASDNSGKSHQQWQHQQ